IPSAAIGKEKGYIHECRDQLGCVRPVTRWCARAETVEEIPGAMHEAFAQMLTGRPRPSAIEIPCDVLDGSADTSFPQVSIPERLQPDSAAITRAAAALRAAQRPVIWAGNGVISSNAVTELRQLAEKLGAPVFSTVLGKGVFPEDHPLSAGSALVHPLAQNYLKSCDALLAVGTRFTQEEACDWKLTIPAVLIHIEVDAEEIGRNLAPTIPVLSDAREALRALHHELASDASDPDLTRSAEVSALRENIIADCRSLAPEGVQLVESLRAGLPREAVVVNDLCIGAYWCRRLLDCYEPRNYVYPWGFCTLGFGLPAGIGAKLARPDRPVVVLSGDGGFLFNCQELAAAVQFNIPLVVVIFNNDSYGVLKPQQTERYGHAHEVDLVNPDFVALAQSFGAAGSRVTSWNELTTALGQAIQSEHPTVIDVPLHVPLPIMEPGPPALFESQHGSPA
ncbi:MAG: thiamine pyrophosphate-dependent enzyme, partial [Pirellulales bacterium]|nr:thiamine pyrophosphate-dependent enzyme [Pirellulales bacterium]